MKVTKGEAGYLRQRKIQLIIKTILEFGIVIALVALGFWQTKTKLNWLTLVAVLGCLPASKALVQVITIFPYASIAEETADQIKSKAAQLTTVFDLVITSEKKIMPIDSFAIWDNTICGYTSSQKVDAAYAGKYIKQMLSQNQYTKVSVKIFTDYTAFLARVEGMQNIAVVDQSDTKKKEATIAHILMNISL